MLWQFHGEGPADPVIADCYAMALDGSALWCCPYAEFPIIRIKDGAIDHWRNDIAGAAAIAVDGNYVLLAGGYNDNAKRLALLRLGEDRAEQVGEWRLPPRTPNAANLLQGQGANLHIVGQGSWTKLSIASLRATLGG